MLSGKDLEIGEAHHRPVIAHEFSAGRARTQTRESQEIDGCFGMSAPHEDTAILRTQRENVPRPVEVRRRRLRSDRGADCPDTVFGGYAGADTLRSFDGDGEGR